MNRIATHWSVPKTQGSFTDREARELLEAYKRDPTCLSCPQCRKLGALHTVEVLAFIEPEVDRSGYATKAPPVGHYAAAVWCCCCRRAIGLEMHDEEV